MERYREYKESGVKWLGEIPSHWEVVPLRKYLKINTRRNKPEAQLLSVTREEGVIVRNVESKEENHNYIPDDLSNYKYVQRGQFVINKMKSWQGSYGVSNYDGIVSPAYFVYDLNYPNKDYFNIAIRSRMFSPFFSKYSKGIRVDQWDLTPEALKIIPFLEPPKAEQDAIVRYLDSATSEIDKAIAMQQKMIDLLNERKQIIIQNAVTKGLDENVEMKESGVEWIGRIPKHWGLIKIKHLAKLQSGSNLTSNDISDIGLYPVYGGNGQRGYYNRYNCEGSYILIGRQGALCGNINYAEGKFWATEHAVVCYPKKGYNTLWLGETLRLMNLGQYSLATAQPGLAVERINGLYLPYPALEEQNGIALFLKNKIDKIDLYAKYCQRQITLLQERKQIIINEVVTGKVRVL